MKIIDSCIFFQELDMLDLRLHILDPVVDFFVIAEAKTTHSGQPKPLYFAENQARFAPFRKKIVHVTTDLPLHVHSWQRERMHRASIASGLTMVAEPGDMIMVGDVDEIPNPEMVRLIPPQGARLELTMFYYNLHTRVREGWSIGALPYGVEPDPNQIRTLEGHDVPVLENAGWHLSYFATPQGIVEKLNAFMHHADIAKDVPRDPEWIAAKVAAGEDLFGRTMILEQVKLDESLPRYLLDHLNQYPQWTRESVR